MTGKGMTPAEVLVGRRLPREASRLDQLLASYVKTDGSFCGRMAPDESWMRPAMLKARRGGLVRHGGLTIRMEGERGRGTGIWFLTPKGEIEAVEARKRVVAANEARRIWSDEWLQAFQTARRRRDDAEDGV
jgi:hypothetical protein